MERSLTTLTIPTAGLAVIAMRGEVVERLARQGSRAVLALLAGINAAIDATKPAAEVRGDPGSMGNSAAAGRR